MSRAPFTAWIVAVPTRWPVNVALVPVVLVAEPTRSPLATPAVLFVNDHVAADVGHEVAIRVAADGEHGDRAARGDALSWDDRARAVGGGLDPDLGRRARGDGHVD